jgi:hypothetical protein
LYKLIKYERNYYVLFKISKTDHRKLISPIRFFQFPGNIRTPNLPIRFCITTVMHWKLFIPLCFAIWFSSIINLSTFCFLFKDKNIHNTSNRNIYLSIYSNTQSCMTKTLWKKNRKKELDSSTTKKQIKNRNNTILYFLIFILYCCFYSLCAEKKGKSRKGDEKKKFIFIKNTLWLQKFI